MQNYPLACAARLFSYIHYRTSRVAGRLSVLIERKIIVMKLNTVSLAGLVSVGLLTIGADSADPHEPGIADLLQALEGEVAAQQKHPFNCRQRANGQRTSDKGIHVSKSKQERPTAKSPEVHGRKAAYAFTSVFTTRFSYTSRMLVTNECTIDQSFQKTMADIESRMETRLRGKGVDRNAT
jgi:hypothetical protein